MTSRNWHFLLLTFLAFTYWGCSGSNSLLGTIANEQLSLSDFEEKYAKYNGGWDQAKTSTLKEREDFLDLLVKFNLKLKEARGKGFPQDNSIQEELESYRYSIATTYVIEKEIVEPNLRKAYEKMKEEIRAFHILIQVDENALPEDTLAAYNKAMQIKELINDTNFREIAGIQSEDPNAEHNGGDLGYFSGGRMVPQFEDAAYNLRIGEISATPVRTRFGYHIVKVVDRRPTKGAVQLSHILMKFADDRSDSTAVRDSVAMIYNFLKAGMSFADAVQRFSDDESSKERSGSIGEYTSDRLPSDLSELLYSTPVNEIADPYRTPYGYHILKVDGRREIPSYQVVEKDLRESYEQLRYTNDYDAYVHKLKEKYSLNIDPTIMDQMIQAFDTTKTPSDETWFSGFKNDLLSRNLFSYSNNIVTVEEFLKRIAGTDEFKNTKLDASSAKQIFDRISTAMLMDEHARQTPERFPAFLSIMKEYEEGILLYRIEQEEVWGKLDLSEEKLRAYYEVNKEKYQWPDRVNFAEIHVCLEEAADSLHAQLVAGEDFSKLAASTTVRPGYQEKKGDWGLISVDANFLATMAWELNVDSISKPVAHEGGWSIIKVIAKEEARSKTFEEAKGEVIGRYQEVAAKKREEEWVQTLKDKYGVSLNKKLLTNAFKRK